ncbi:hypothetical protein BH11BAC5_BH11BAC5_46860 [soil metagenome]
MTVIIGFQLQHSNVFLRCYFFLSCTDEEQNDCLFFLAVLYYRYTGEYFWVDFTTFDSKAIINAQPYVFIGCGNKACKR